MLLYIIAYCAAAKPQLRVAFLEFEVDRPTDDERLFTFYDYILKNPSVFAYTKLGDIHSFVFLLVSEVLRIFLHTQTH